MQFNRPIVADNLLVFREHICFIDLFLDEPGLAGLPLLSFFHFFSKGILGDKWHRLQWAGCPFCTPTTCQTTEHTQPFYGAFSRTTWVNQCQKKSSSGLCGAREDIRGRHADNPAGCHSIRTNQLPTSLITIFMWDALRATTLPIYPGLGQTPNMLSCIPSGLSKH